GSGADEAGYAGRPIEQEAEVTFPFVHLFYCYHYNGSTKAALSPSPVERSCYSCHLRFARIHCRPSRTRCRPRAVRTGAHPPPRAQWRPRDPASSRAKIVSWSCYHPTDRDRCCPSKTLYDPFHWRSSYVSPERRSSSMASSTVRV